MTKKGLILLMLFVGGFTACNSYKKLEKKNADALPKASASKQSQSQESKLFFDAEKARLLGDTKLAYSLYTAFVESFPSNATARYNLARLQFQRQDLNGAEKNAQQAVNLQPDNKYFIELYAELLLYLKKNSQAEALLNTLVQKHPDDEDYLYRQAMFFVKGKEYEKALKSLDQLESKTGFNEDIILKKKSIYAIQGKTDLAIQELKRLQESNPQSVEYPMMMIEVYESAGQKEKSTKIIEDLELNYGNDPKAQYTLSQYYLNQKNYIKSDLYMQKVMKNKNLDPETKISLIIPRLKVLEGGTQEDKDLVLEMSKAIAEESADNKDAVSLYAEVLLFLKRNDEALFEFKKALKLDQSKFQTWNQIISIYLDKQQMDSVVSYADKSIVVFPNNALPYFYKGIALVQAKKPELAIQPLNHALDLESENQTLIAQLYATLGDVYNTQQNFSYSDSCFEKALKIQPDDASTLNNYAYYLSVRKVKLSEAERMSKKSLELMPNSKSFLDTYGWILYQQGNYKEAKIYIEKAIDAAGDDDGTLLEHLGDVYYKINEIEKAIEYWKKAKSKGEDNPILFKKISEGKLYE